MSNNNSNHNNSKQGNPAAALQRLERPAERVKAGLGKAVKALQKINLGKLIDDMEKDQNLADRLEMMNRDVYEEAERKAMVQEALAKCRAEMEEHLATFLFFHPDATYEEWIQDLHPENVSQGQLLTDMTSVDMRFYVADSDHRLLWNARMAEHPNRQVAARSYQPAPGEHVPLDLLNSSNVGDDDNDDDSGDRMDRQLSENQEDGGEESRPSEYESSYGNNNNNNRNNDANNNNQQLFDFLS